MKKALSFMLVAISIVLFVAVVFEGRKLIGQEFPGKLVYANGLPGPFGMPGWDGPQEFGRADFFGVVLLPALSGLLFVLLGAAVSSFFEEGRGRLMFFHLLTGNYLILSPDFHLGHRYIPFLLVCFSLIPAAMLDFALSFPSPRERGRMLHAIPYVLSGLLLCPYLWLFFRNPPVWLKTELVVVSYAAFAYLFWIARLVRELKSPELEFRRILARTVLIGQVVAFAVPFAAAIAVFVFRVSVPLNFLAPLVLLFPCALFVGVVLGRLQQDRMRLVQTEKMATLGTLMAGLAHEIKNPLNFVVANIEPLKESIDHLGKLLGAPFASNVRELSSIADHMDEGTRRLAGVIENFKPLTVSDGGKMTDVNVGDMIEKTIRLLAPKWKDKIRIERDFAEGRDSFSVRASQSGLGQVLVNLIANACEAMEGGGTLTVKARRDGRFAEIRIRDTGPGIPENLRHRIFDPFFTTKAPGQGTGLGLAIVQRIVREHGGTIEVISEEGKGTEFVVSLPLL